MERDLTQGKIGKSILLFSIPMILGNLLQQFYNIVDTYIVGQYIGSNALAAVGSSYTLMTFLLLLLVYVWEVVFYFQCILELKNMKR